jgi:ATP synthase protein I
MKDDRPLPSLEQLDEKLRAAEAKRRKTKAGSEDQGQGLAFAMRIGVEIVSALIVGVAIGYFLDRWLGTKPWFLLLFFVLGAAAGFMNVFRVVGGLGGQVGYRKVEKPEDESSKRVDSKNAPQGRDVDE